MVLLIRKWMMAIVDDNNSLDIFQITTRVYLSQQKTLLSFLTLLGACEGDTFRWMGRK